MSVEQIMNKAIITVGMDDSLYRVKSIFEQHNFHHLLVLDKGKLVGVVSDRDLLKAISPKAGTMAETRKDRATLNRRVHQIMTRKPITLTKDAGIREAIHVFNTHGISCIPIVENEDKVIGIISWRDVFKAIESHLKPTVPVYK